MIDKPDYTSYSYQELVDAYNHVDHNKYPERFAELEQLIENFTQTAETSIDDKKFAYQENISGLEFKGDTKEFFSIWIVNVFLSIITLGIYSAWAKVRTKTYFYSNTYLDGASFRYHAQPLQILRGRIIAVVIFAVYFTSSYISMTVLAATLAVLAVLMPAFITMSLAFKMRMVSYKNVRFTFAKDFKKAYLIFSIPFAAAVIALFYNLQLTQALGSGDSDYVKENYYMVFLPFILIVFFPVFEYLLFKFRVNHSGFGTGQFRFDAKVSTLYKYYFIGFILLLVGSFLFGFIFSMIVSMISESGGTMNEVVTYIIMIPFAITYMGFFAYITAKRMNYVYNNSTISNLKLHSEISAADMFSLYVTNTFGIMFSLGLLVPWAMIRTTRYKLSMITVISEDEIGDFVAGQKSDQSAYGEEVGDLFDIGIGV